MTPVQGTAPSPSIIDQILETALRRQYQMHINEYRTITENLDRVQLFGDRLEVAIFDWLKDYKRSLDTALNLRLDINEVRRRYINILKATLIDPVNGQILDERPCLGSDGRTYSGMTIDVHHRISSPQNRERSPLEPNNPQRFTVREHNAARAIIRFLKKIEEYKQNPATIALYNRLMNTPAPTAPAPKVPTPKVPAPKQVLFAPQPKAQAPKQVLVAPQAKAPPKQAPTAREMIAQIQAQQRERMVQQVQGNQREIQNFEQRVQAVAASLFEQGRQQFEEVRQQGHEHFVEQREALFDLGAEARENVQRLLGLQNRQAQALEVLGQQRNELEGEIRVVANDIQSAKQETMQLHENIIKAQERIAESNNNLLGTVAGIVACAIVMWALPEALPALQGVFAVPTDVGFVGVFMLSW